MQSTEKPLARIRVFDHALTVTELATVLNVSKITIKRLCAARALPYFKVAGCVRFHPVTIERWLEQQTRPALVTAA